VDAVVRYWAFLSYSHADRVDAERLHRALEGYRIPSRLVGQPGPLGPLPPRLLPIFRDRDELTASGHIGASVEAALASSRALVVLCSPDAAQSQWVDAEIAAYRRLRPDSPVLCAVLRGQPLASRDPSCAGEECLPPSLRAQFGNGAGTTDSTPLAVDMREQGDGWRRAVQKLVAALADVSLDQLVQRDAHRRHARMAWLSALLAAIAIAFGAMAFVAGRARDEARMQRTQAEGLVEFMLGDLRDRLEPVGRLDVLDAVGARSLRYYDSQDPRTLDADALGRRSRALHLIGEISDRRGDIEGARAAFQRALDTTAELLKRDPDDGQRVYEHSQSVAWLGNLDWERGDRAAAERAQREYLRLAERLHQIDSGNPAWFAQLGYAHSNLGTMLKDQGKTDAALAQYELARDVFQQLHEDKPADTTRALDLGQAWSWLSSSYADALRLDDALRARDREIALYGPLLARDPHDATVLERSVIARRFHAQLLVDRGELGAAAREAADVVRASEAQLQLDPTSAVRRKAAAKAHLLQAQVFHRLDEPAKAMPEIERARSLVDGMLARDDEAWAWRVELQESLAQLEADVLRSLGDRDAAMRLMRDSLQRLRPAMRDTSRQDKAARWLALSEARLAQLQRDAGDAASARTSWLEVAALLEHSERLDPEALAWLSRARFALGRQAEALRVRERLVAAGYHHPQLDARGAIADRR
jgi:tetratricopeptide (TPR) repeat protein